MMAKYKLWDIVEIFWEDSHMIHGWTALNETDIELEHSLGHRSIGYFIGETAKQISICQSSKTFEDFISEPETQVCGVFTIPKRAITKVTSVSNEYTTSRKLAHPAPKKPNKEGK